MFDGDKIINPPKAKALSSPPRPWTGRLWKPLVCKICSKIVIVKQPNTVGSMYIIDIMIIYQPRPSVRFILYQVTLSSLLAVCFAEKICFQLSLENTNTL